MADLVAKALLTTKGARLSFSVISESQPVELSEFAQQEAFAFVAAVS